MIKFEVHGVIAEEISRKLGQSNGKDWEAREYLITEFGQFGRSVRFTMFSGDGPIMTPLKVGEAVSVSLSIQARQYNGKWFNDVRLCDVKRSE